MSCRVYKFGGASLSIPENIEKVAKIIMQDPKNLCVVISPWGELTSDLGLFYQFSISNEVNQQSAILKKIEDYFVGLVKALFPNGRNHQLIMADMAAQLEILGNSGNRITSHSPLPAINHSYVLSFGERILANLLCYLLKDRNQSAMVVESSELIKVTQGSSEFFPDDPTSIALTKKKLAPLLEYGPVIIPGSFAQNALGETILLGTGGADYSACLIASYLNAAEVCLYKDSEGIKTADPKHVFQARTIPELHYREAVELAFFGANILHPRSIIPLIKDQIPLWIRSTFFPQKQGTKIWSKPSYESYPVKGLSFIENQSMISIEGKGMMGVPGVASKAFGVMAEENISVSFITQASSESSICFIVPGSLGDLAVKRLNAAFESEFRGSLIDEVRLTEHLSIIAIVGLGMIGTPGIAARAFSAVARERINIKAIAQGASELNISLVTETSQAAKALRCLHKEYGLDQLRATSTHSFEQVNLFFLGFGQIGKTLARQIIDQKEYFDTKLKIHCNIVSLGDRSGLTVKDEGFNSIEIEEFIANKTPSKKIVEFDCGIISNDISVLWQKNWSRKILVDLTSSDSIPAIRNALNAGFHIVLANKQPLTCPYEEYLELFELASQQNVQIRYEATVGAGLPVLDTIEKLIETGDQVTEILGCLSGTLGFILSQLEDGIDFSVALREAHSKGYTEPDPRDDLSGKDVARKALILARSIGLKVNFDAIELEPFISNSYKGCDVSTFLDRVHELNSTFLNKIQSASEKGMALRYVARISRNAISVGLEEISRDSALGRLKGTDNQVTITTKRYIHNPLIVTGPGAGAEVTAAGVLSDIINIASSQERTRVI
jgi:aspartokinase/homoserine dehydrogenase 1